MRFSLLGMALMAVALTGCVSGGSQFENTLYNTHSIVARLDKNLQGSVEKLNQTSAELSAKADATDQSVKALQSTMEENSRRLTILDKKLDSLIKGVTRAGGFLPATPQPTNGTPIVPPTPEDASKGSAPVPPPAEATPAPTSETPAPPAPVSPAETPSTPPPTAPAAATEPPRSSNGEKADFEKARGSYSTGNFAVAAQQFDAFVKAYPKGDNAANAAFWKAKSLLGMKNYNEAIKQFEQFRATYPAHPRVPYAIVAEGQSYSGLGQKAKAQELFNEVLKNYPGSAAADLVKGEIKNLKGN